VFRHFAALSNELTRTKILVCPSDDREVAPCLDELQNTNLTSRDAKQMPQPVFIASMRWR
jgi:hypothetical protein